ncbi:hypothetical protein Bbelb_131830 [Branchiostoma belcheri]|nr:hypothetical protein Bbelb_131830 [Branchiostoma belcheri]
MAELHGLQTVARRIAACMADIVVDLVTTLEVHRSQGGGGVHKAAVTTLCEAPLSSRTETQGHLCTTDTHNFLFWRLPRQDWQVVTIKNRSIVQEPFDRAAEEQHSCQEISCSAHRPSN